jgi:hypothetical protein
MPACGFLLACKPTIGAALWAAYPSRAAALGSVVFLAVSLMLLPSWPLEWFATLGEVPHVAPPVSYLGGPLLLLALLRWRRPEARLLAALACVPQTLMFYETLPLFLIVRTHAQGAILATGSWVALVASYSSSQPDLAPMARYIAERTLMGRWIVWDRRLQITSSILPRCWHPGRGRVA